MADTTTTLRTWLNEGPFSLVISPGFFAFFAQLGAVQALDAALPDGFSDVVHAASGCSAGGVSVCFLASGMSLEAMERELTQIQRADLLDPIGVGGLCRGAAVQHMLAAKLSAQGVFSFDDCLFPVAVTAFNVLRCRTEVLCSDKPVALSLAASAAVPGLFQPVQIDGKLLVDGALGDPTGCWGLPALPPSGRVLTIGLDQNSSLPYSTSAAPHKLRPELVAGVDVDMVTLCLGWMPSVG